MLRGKKILLGITGSIAAYKGALIIRSLISEGAEVKVVMSPSAGEFISALTLSTLSKNPVYTDFIKNDQGEWNNHVALGLWADLMLIAPATANTLAKMSHGIADNLLLAVYLSARCPVYFAPAMDLDMYVHPATKNNLEKLKSYGHVMIPSEHGELASGLIGTGRMAEPETIINHLKAHFNAKKSLSGKKALVTAGPTYEKIDPVRFIGNYSSGKMGYSIVTALQERGCEVTLITGPTSIPVPEVHKVIRVTSAHEMYHACLNEYHGKDMLILAAAVADFTPTETAPEKIKKKETEMVLHLQQTTDIARELGIKKGNNQLLIGFALETQHEEENARKKLLSKNFDMIVLNSLKDSGAGFQHDTNKITIFDKEGNTTKFKLKSKSEVALDIIKAIESKMDV